MENCIVPLDAWNDQAKPQKQKSISLNYKIDGHCSEKRERECVCVSVCERWRVSIVWISYSKWMLIKYSLISGLYKYPKAYIYTYIFAEAHFDSVYIARKL